LATLRGHQAASLKSPDRVLAKDTPAAAPAG
jgi:hypothetical protein